MQKNLDLIFSILDLEISIPDLENSKRAFRKKNQIDENLTPIFVNFSQEISQKSQNEISAK